MQDYLRHKFIAGSQNLTTMKKRQILSAIALFFTASFSATAQSNDQIQVVMNKQSRQLEVIQKSDGKNITANFSLQRAEMEIFADGDSAGVLEIKNTWNVPIQEFEDGEIVHLEEVELLEKSSGKTIKLSGDTQIFP